MIWLTAAFAGSPGEMLLTLKVGREIVEMRDDRGCVSNPLHDGTPPLDLQAGAGQVRGAEQRQRGLWLKRRNIRDGSYSFLIQKIPLSKYKGRVYFDSLEPLRPFFDCDYMPLARRRLVEKLEELSGRLARRVLMELIASNLARSEHGMSCGWAVGEFARECWRGSCTRWVDRVKEIDEHGCPEVALPHGWDYLTGWPGQREF